MILVDIYVPVINETFDFQLDENIFVDSIIDEVVAILGKKMKNDAVADASGFELYGMEREEKINRESTLFAAGIKDGSRLMLL